MKMWIVHHILRQPMRQFFIDKVKKPLMKAIVTIARRYPYPDKNNTVQNNAHILIEIRDQFLEYCDNPNRKPLFEALFRVLIDEYEHDPYYRHRIDFIVEKIVEANINGKWQHRPKGKPKDLWKEFSKPLSV